MRGLFGRLRTRLGRLAGIAVSLLIVAGFAFVLLQIATGSPVARTFVGDDPTATSPLFAYQTPTPTSVDAPPTPTFYAPGNATPTPRPRNIPFSVEWPSRGGPDVQCMSCNSSSVTLSGCPCYCPPEVQFDAQTEIYVTDGAPGGTATYRWITDLGPTTPVLSVNLQPGDGVNGSNFIDTHWVASAALGDGANHWAQAEVLTPNHLLGPRVWFNMHCDYAVVQADPGEPIPQFDCSGPDTQTLSLSAQAAVSPGPPGHSVTYHWLRSDGSVSSSYTTAVPGGATTFALQGDSVTLSRSMLPSGTSYWDKIVVDSPTPFQQAQAVTIANGCS